MQTFFIEVVYIKYFVVSDVHSFYDEMIFALEQAGFDKNNDSHIFVSCGDLFDRGPKPLECLQFVNSLPNDRKILIRGNHEDLLEDCFERNGLAMHDFYNHTNDTVIALATNCNKYESSSILCSEAKKNMMYNQYSNYLVDYAEVKDYIFVHGWIPVKIVRNKQYLSGGMPKPKYMQNWRNASIKDWKNSRWRNGIDMALEYKIIEPNKTIICGHWHCSYGHEIYGNGNGDNFSPFYSDGIIAIDACTAVSHKVNCIVLEV